MKKCLTLVLLLLSLSLTVNAQTFSSGSTGADGALDLSNAPDNQPFYIQLPESGVLNYTTVNIPLNKRLIFKRNSRNTPVVILVQGDVSIGGEIDVSNGEIVTVNNQTYEDFRIPGPGGFYGGDFGRPGFGPGGGVVTDTDARNGRWVGALSLIPIVGGSGGAGNINSVTGAGGGGAIAIASSASISILFRGGINATSYCFTCSLGSGGSIRLVANTINMHGGLNATAGGAVSSGNSGLIRLEAPIGAITFTGSSQPAAILSAINSTINPSASPALTIASVGGYAVPSNAGARFDTVDLLLPNQLSDPINVVVRAANIPVGTQINVGFVSGSGQATAAPGTLSGSFASSSATATISNLNRTGVTYLLATAVFDVPQSAASFNPAGTNHVERVRLEAAPNKQTQFIFLRRNGSRIDSAKLSPAFLQHFGQ